ncbi:LysR family transcriptional regulator [Tranquillimonas alkanivorans]|uniref:LysR family transcriptional regulator, glycine cleavage system transcriptional activator n=1 Tax=Tranquillimonas alkanivorans TaxID=441119 RepID=A0A1I5KI97_9RHOB|nr:LysR family transcriptional regulator [Tranquillimonas alkanivorans]SFO84281.1 LysR family transcriptional regulator, glycine cleavage system transcriptional activator [Tranquillimonas alkanivorans]
MDWRTFPPLGALRAFAALAEHGSLSAAGAALNVSHAAISQQLRTLESHLGVMLVDRGGRRLTLTPEGDRLAEALLNAFGAIGVEIDALTGADAARPLQITTTPLFASNWLMDRLSAFRAVHPGIDIMVNPTPVVADPTPGGIDIAIRYGLGDWPGFESELLIDASLVVVAADSLIGAREIEKPSDLLDLPWLQEVGTTEINDWLTSHGVTAQRTGAMTHLPGNLILESVRRGDGVSATARAFVEPDIEEGRVRVLFEDEMPDRGYYLVTRPSAMRPAARAFAAWIRKAAREGAT